MKKIDMILLVTLAAIWGSSFVFMRISVEAFGAIALNAVRISVAALFLLGFLLQKKRRAEFLNHWRILLIIGLINSALPFCLLAYSSLTLSGGTVSILNAITPIFTAWIAHVWLKDTLNRQQILGLIISISGMSYLVWEKVDWTLESWLPILAAIIASLSYGVASNATKKYLKDISTMTSSAGCLFFSAIFVVLVAQFFLPDFQSITSLEWGSAIMLGILCTGIAFMIYFRLVKSIGPSRTVSVTFLIPIFAFIWGYLFLGEVVTMRMWIATIIILSGMSLVTGVIDNFSFKKQHL